MLRVTRLAPAWHVTPVVPGDVVADRFEIERVAGVGGMGAVYRALDRARGVPVALKVALHGPERFLRESAVLSRLRHPNIVGHVAHGPLGEDGVWLAMDWLDGEDLAQRLARGPLPVDETLVVARAVAAGLAHAHERGIVHRDVKPANVFLPRGDLAAACVLDFGVALTGPDESRLTAAGGIVGTPTYMGPEQARAVSDITAAADVYSLGAVVFECVTGRPPFEGEHAVAVLAKILLEDAPRLGDLVGELPAGLEDLVARMLAKERALRPCDGAAVLRALDALGSEPVRRASLLPRSTLTHAEQRVVCVLLAAGTTDARAATISPEEHHAAVERALAAVARRGGRAERLANGGIVATFQGAASPSDDAASAASAALAMSEALGDVPIAVATGRALVGAVVPVGEVVDRAAAQLAPGGPVRGVLLDTGTAALLAPRFVVDDRDGHRVLSAERAAPSATRPLLGRAMPCLGRRREVSTLRMALEACVEEPGARAVLVSAPAGVGKSRLVDELVRASGVEGLEVLRVGGDALHGDVPFALATQLVRLAAGFAPGEGSEGRRAKLRARIATRVPPADQQVVFELLAELAACPVPDEAASAALLVARADPASMGDALRVAVSRWLAAESVAAPLLLVVEDLQWADAPSVALFDAVLRALHERPVMLLGTARPEVHATFPGLFAEHGLQEIRLGLLTPKASEELVRAALGEAVPDDVVEGLVARAGGNPFFLEELVRGVADGRDPRALPDTVLGMLQVRFEALDAGARRVLRAASVFGERFPRDGVVALLGAADADPAVFRRLTQLEVLQVVGGAGETDFAFRHALLRDAAYAMLTEADRGLGHRLAAEWLETTPWGEGEPATIAHHFACASAWVEAVQHARRSAERAASLSRFSEAAAALAQALDWLARTPEDDARKGREAVLLLEEARLRETLGDRARHAALVERLLQLDCPEHAVVARVRHGELLALRGEHAAARTALEAAITLSGSRADARGELLARRSLAFVCWQQGDYAASRDENEAAVALDRALGDRHGEARDLLNLANVLTHLGDIERVHVCLDESAAASGPSPRPHEEVSSLNARTAVFARLGDLDGQIATTRRMLAIQEAHGLFAYKSISLAALGGALAQGGRLAEALESYAEAVSLARALDTRPQLARALRGYTAVLVSSGRDAEAVPALREASEMLAGLGELRDALEAVVAAARVARTQKDAAVAQACFEAACGLAQRLDAPDDEADHRNTLGILAWERGEFEAALGHYERARALFDTAGDRVHLGVALNSLGVTLSRLGRLDDAEARLLQAVEVSHAVGERLVEGHGHAALGDVLLARGANEAAALRYEASLALRRQIGDRRGEGWMLHHIARACARAGDGARARESAEAAASIAVELGDAALSAAVAAILSPRP